MPAAQVMIESQYETGYTTGDTGNGLDRDHTDYLYRYVLRLLQPQIVQCVRKYLLKAKEASVVFRVV